MFVERLSDAICSAQSEICIHYININKYVTLIVPKNKNISIKHEIILKKSEVIYKSIFIKKRNYTIEIVLIEKLFYLEKVIKKTRIRNFIESRVYLKQR